MVFSQPIWLVFPRMRTLTKAVRVPIPSPVLLVGAEIRVSGRQLGAEEDGITLNLT
jgi:hypothetical protein